MMSFNRRAWAALLLLASQLALPLSVRADVTEDVATYATDRAHDFLDIFRLRAGYPNEGKGIGAKARVTSLAQVGYVYFDGTYAGMDRRGVGIVDERRREGGVSLAYGSFNQMVPRTGNDFLYESGLWGEVEDRRILRNVPHHDDGRKRYLSLGAEVATPIAAIDAGLYPEEAFDFLLGIFTIDFYRDDELRDFSTRTLEPTTPAGPDTSAPFASKRERYEAFKEQMEAEFPPGTTAPETVTDEELQNPLSTIGARPGVIKTTDESISQDEADRALREARTVDEGGTAPAEPSATE